MWPTCLQTVIDLQQKENLNDDAKRSQALTRAADRLTIRLTSGLMAHRASAAVRSRSVPVQEGSMRAFVRGLALLGIGGGVAALCWYESLGVDEKENADRIAAEYARRLFGKRLGRLDAAETARARRLARRHFE